jgi:hypothetical protein
MPDVWGHNGGLLIQQPAPELFTELQGLTRQPESVRFNLVTEKIGAERSFGRDSAEAVMRAAGYTDPGQYWHTFLSRPRRLDGFIGVLARHMFSPSDKREGFDRRLPIEHDLQRALRQARDWRPPLFRQIGEDRRPSSAWVERFEVDPLRAIKWLLRSQEYRVHVPDGLRAVVEGAAGTESAAEITPETTKTRPGAKKKYDRADIERGLQLCRVVGVKSYHEAAERVFDERHPATEKMSIADKEKRERERTPYVKWLRQEIGKANKRKD